MKLMMIEQIERANDNRGCLFMDYEFTKEHGGVVSEEYTIKYLCNRPDDYTPDDAFEEFNLHRPNDFKGHSLSVSDIVTLGNSRYFCDSFGWIYLGTTKEAWG